MCEDGDQGVDAYSSGYEDKTVDVAGWDWGVGRWVGEGAADADFEVLVQDGGDGLVEVLGWWV